MLNQAKGTPEQMLAQLKKAGAKDAEISAAGLDQFLAGKPSVTSQDIISHLEGNRVGLREVIYGSPVLSQEALDAKAMQRYRKRFSELHPDVQRHVTRELTEDVDTPKAQWSSYSLDPSNPTYRETVLHLPESAERATRKELEERAVAKYGQRWIEKLTPAEMDELEAATKAAARTDFRSGHFTEVPNIVGHMMTSMTRHEGKPVFTIDQIQSDWGQKIRDGGVRDEAKIAELTARYERAAIEAQKESTAILDDLKQLGWTYSKGAPRAWAEKNAPDMLSRIDGAGRERDLLDAELKTAKASTPGHPLVNTTDQWTNTTLRRALRQAADAGAEYIAVPSGDTVLSYNPGDFVGMRNFYGGIANPAEVARYSKALRDAEAQGARSDPKQTAALKDIERQLKAHGDVEGIVPKNLRKILAKIDPDAARSIVSQTLDTPSRGPAGKGFSLFPITPKVRETVMREGQPLFSMSPVPGTLLTDPSQERTIEDILRLYGGDQ